MKMNKKKIWISLLLFINTIVQAKTISITNSGQFQQEVTEGNQPAVVKFYTEWCGPCKMSKVPFHQVSDQPEFSHIKFVEVNADKNAALMSKFNIGGFPTFIFMVGPSIKHKTSGALGASDPDDFKVRLEKTLRQLFPTTAQGKETEEEMRGPSQQKTGLWATVSHWFSSLAEGIKQFFSSIGNTINGWFSR